MRTDSPMLRQYHGVKEQHPDKLLFFRMGDFYELFYADAERAAALLGLTLTKRKTSATPIPMAGVPVNSVEQYISRLVRIGEAVVICEQVGEQEGKGLIERKVTQIVTPGTLTEESLLPQRASAVAMAVAPSDKGAEPSGYAWLDLARGELRAGACPARRLADHVARLQPVEMVLPEGAAMPGGYSGAVRHLPQWEFEASSAHYRMCERFEVRDLRGFGLEGQPQSVAAAMALLGYAERTQCRRLEHLWQVGAEMEEGRMALDSSARRSLEINAPLVSGGPTLLSTLDNCVTSMGSRLLARRLQDPVLEREELNARLDMVDAVSDIALSVSQWYQGTCDLERVITRIALGSVRPRELAALRDMLARLPKLRAVLAGISASDTVLRRLRPLLQDDFTELERLLADTLAADPPAQVRDGGAIAAGYDAKLDELRSLADGSSAALRQIELRERKASGITALRVGQNRVHGYYIEVPRSQGGNVPSHYQRRQTIKNAERFVTDELRRLEAEAITAVESAAALERKLYAELVLAVTPHLVPMRHLAETLAELDVASTLAQLASNNAWIRPAYRDEPGVYIKGGRHPVVEGSVSHFVPNDTKLGNEVRMQVITGPNMGGKSTYMRQVALLALLAHAGMPVPAAQAEFGRIDSIQTRIGAADDLAGGRSTFMVEMSETAAILNTAGPASLVLLDEIGRGTSTFDGLSLAWATARALLTNNNSIVLMATHYLELADLATTCAGVRNVHMAVGEEDGEVVMLHRVEQGAANRSFGLHVARMAGIPAHAIREATRKLKQLEVSSGDSGLQEGLFAHESLPPEPEVEPNLPLERLQDVKVDNLTPRQALELLYELQSMLEGK